MINAKTIVVIIFLSWILFARADQEKLPEQFFSNAELFSKIDMIEQLTVLENITDKDLTMAQQGDLSDSTDGNDTP